MNPRLQEKIILLVEDNEDDEVLTIRALKKHSVANHVVVARDGAEALDYLFARGAFADRPDSEAPELVLLDLKIPKVSGLQVLEQIRAHDKTRRLPVVILTSSKEEQDLAQSYNLGANSYIRKPVDFNQFTDAIRTLGLYWMVLNEPPPKTPLAAR